MRPSIGRIVHFKAPGECGGEVYAAIVTRVNDDGTCELATFGPNSVYFQHNIPELTDRTKMELGGWFWPPRDEKQGTFVSVPT